MQSLKLFAWLIVWLVGALSCDADGGTGKLVNSCDEVLGLPVWQSDC